MSDSNSVLSFLSKDDILADADVFVLFVARNGKIIRINRRGSEELDIDPGEITGRNWFDDFVAEGETVRREFTDFLDDPQQDLFRQEYPVGTGDESRISCIWNNRPIRDEDGILMCVVVSGHPLEGPVEYPEDLVRDAESYRSFMEKAFAGRILFMENPLRIVFASSPTEEILGYSTGELTAMGPSEISDLFHPDSRDEFLRCFTRIHDEKLAGRAELGMVRRDGSQVWMAAYFSRTVFQEENALQILLADMTESRMTYLSMRESEEKYRTLVEHSNDSIVIHRDGVIVFANRTACELTGFPMDDILGSSIMNFVAPDYEALVLRNMTNRISGKEVPSIYNIEVLRSEGNNVPVEVNVSEVHYGGKKAYMIILRDLSERRQLEEQIRQSHKMEAIGQLAGGVAHDFNNILQVINGYTELAENSLEEDHPVKEMVRQIAGAGERASELVSQLLLFSRNQVIVTSIVDLNQIVSDHLSMLKRVMGEEISIQMEPSQEPIYVNADHSMMGQILLNICLNARDAMPQGGEITVKTERVYLNSEFCEANKTAQPGYHALLSISDTGYGMDEKTMGRIFEPFFSTKGITAGTGLGLSTVYGIVTQHDGLIMVDSQEGNGATFSIYLPVADRSIEIEEIPQEYEMVETVSRTVIIAEDDENVRNLAYDVLSNAGHEVITASDGQEAVVLVTDSPDSVDLVILDAVMPVMNGFEAADKIREVRPDMPLIFCSGYSREKSSEDVGRFRDNVKFLLKPYSMSQLMTAMNELFSEKN